MQDQVHVQVAVADNLIYCLLDCSGAPAEPSFFVMTTMPAGSTRRADSRGRMAPRHRAATPLRRPPARRVALAARAAWPPRRATAPLRRPPARVRRASSKGRAPPRHRAAAPLRRPPAAARRPARAVQAARAACPHAAAPLRRPPAALAPALPKPRRRP